MQNVQRIFLISTFIIKVSEFILAPFSGSMAILQRLKAQQFRVKLKDLHKQAFYVLINGIQNQGAVLA